MFKLSSAAIILSAAATAAMAGGVERTSQSVGVLFEEGRYFEFSLSGASPSVSGIDTTGGPTTGGSSGDIAKSFLNFGAAYKADLNTDWSYAIIYDQPYGAGIQYPTAFYFATGSTADLETHALTGILQYNMDNNVSLYGGLRAQTLKADASVFPATLGYTATTENNLEFGYLLGVAYEKPEIALRVALTYLSAIAHQVDTVENGVLASVTEIETPQAINLEFQSGVAEDTLVFGSVRWAEWSEFEIAPIGYVSNPATGGLPLVSFADDRITYTLGLGRRLNETWSVAGSLSYEETTGSLTGNLGPTDGFLRASLGASYTKDNMKISGGVTYVDIGNATTRVVSAPSGTGGRFTGNSAIGAGIKVGFTF